MRAALVLCALAFIVLVNGASRPTASVPNCDAASDQWGCPENQYRIRNFDMSKDRLRCLKRPEPRMSWAYKVRRSNKYKTWAGRDEDKPMTSYIPNSIIDINIRVNAYKEKYRGILIYAMDDAGKRVGEWVLPKGEDNPFFQIPWPDSHECRQSLTHSTAELKPLKSTIKFRTPAKGTGKLTFHCLVKQGDANTGAFYWPNGASGPLTLTESNQNKPRLTWFASKRGQSCDARCAEENLKCDRVHMERVNSPQRIVSLILNQDFPCKLPYVSGCGNLGATMGEDGLCYFDDTRCGDQGRNTAAVTCASSSGNRANGLRMCKCVTTTLPPANPGRTVIAARDASTSPASKTTVSFFVMALALLGLTMKSSSKMTTSVALALFLVALVAMPSVNAHNWQFSPGRSKDVASTVTPCPSRIQLGPHVQVGPNQKYEIEWAVGHTQPSYYVVVKAEDEPLLRTVTFDKMDKYMNDAPNSACKNLPVYHRQFRARDSSFDPHQQFYSGAIPRNAGNFIPRPDAFGEWRDDATLFGYKDQYEVKNYCEYSNNVLPFALAIFKFDHLAHRPQDADMVRLSMPAGAAPGAYVVMWLWRGYRDCIDIDYVTNQVSEIYGVANPAGGYIRVDHCYFPDPRDIFQCHRIFDDHSVCARGCHGGCHGYVLLPRVLPSNRYNGAANLIPQLCKDVVKNLGEPWENVDMCYSVRARRSSETFGPYEITHAGDPAYHSTCMLKGSGRYFPSFETPPQHQDIPWRHGDNCISCDAVNMNKNITRTPKWPMINDCRNCDLEPKRDTPVYKPPQLLLLNTSHQCDGHGWWQNVGWQPGVGGIKHHTCKNGDESKCTKQLLIRGRVEAWNKQHFAGECAANAARDPECSDTIYTRELTWLKVNGKFAKYCYCYTKRGCCKNCRHRKITKDYGKDWNIWRLDKGTHNNGS